MSPVLTAKDLHAGYGLQPVLSGITITVERGERVLLVGPNGSGKSTLLKALTGLIPLFGGQIALNGKPITQLPTDRRIRSGIGYLMQTRNIFVSLTVDENLRLVDQHSGRNRRDWILTIFPFLGERIRQRAGLLSGGERQGLALAMVLMGRIDVLLMDEPTAGLAPIAAASILEGVDRAQGEENFCLLIVEHNIRAVAPWVSRAVIMNRGRIVAEEAKPTRLLTPGKLEGYYFR